MLSKVKKSINKFLEEIAKENQKVYGKGGLDCCKINRNSNDQNNVKK